jgi:hypothetical protein
MKLVVTSVMLALCVALPPPTVADASDGVNPVHKHRIHPQLAVPGRFNSAATALVPTIGIIRAPALTSNDDSDGLSRDRDQCNRGCIDN